MAEKLAIVYTFGEVPERATISFVQQLLLRHLM
jgi:hypothetical protein